MCLLETFRLLQGASQSGPKIFRFFRSWNGIDFLAAPALNRNTVYVIKLKNKSSIEEENKRSATISE